MTLAADGGDSPFSTSSYYPSPNDVTMDLTMCGLLTEQTEELARLYASHGNWNDVRQIWFDERLSKRSTRGSSQKIYRILTSRLKSAPTTLPNPKVLPRLFNDCRTTQDKAQIIYLYLIADDPLVRYIVTEYSIRITQNQQEPLDFSNEVLTRLLGQLEYDDGSGFDYADSTTRRWCEGFRSVMREIGALEGQQSVIGTSPSINDIPLLVAMDYSYTTDDDWITAPRGLRYLFQAENRWEELFDRVAATDVWEYQELHGELDLRPSDEPYSWITTGGEV
jgi:hypothetical protein